MWGIAIIISVFSGGVQSILNDEGLIETIILSVYTKWILLSDIIWMCFFIVFILSRKQYKTESNLHYLTYKPLESISICVVIPAWNEAKSIEKVITDFQKQKFVKHVLLVDNNSSDNTVEIAQKVGAIVIKKNENKGYSHSVLLGLKEALKTDSNVVLFTEADSTYNGYDIEKMLSYLPNADMVLGSRYTQVLSEKGNQNSLMHIWGNILLAKLIQIKYFSLKHLGAVNLTDVGCAMRLMRRECLEKIIPLLSSKDSEYPYAGDSIQLHITMLSIEKNFRLVEIPITFNKRIGYSKFESSKFTKGIKWGAIFMWFILKS
ncbi:glycosyltransferase family 2 protein [Nitrosopumilus sp.]|uniref:glycosyltransferase family 2 protein n=1 Tax=Nitrosopumilus sp. TaxID=2024843 RepID=UPI003D11A386